METDGTDLEAEFLSTSTADVFRNNVDDREAVGFRRFKLEHTPAFVCLFGSCSRLLTLIQDDGRPINHTREPFIVGRDELQR